MQSSHGAIPHFGCERRRRWDGHRRGGTAGTNDGTTQVAPGNAVLEHNINDDGGGGGGAYGYVVVNLE